MPMSPYVAGLRAALGPARLLLPSVTAIVRDEQNRILLVRQRDSGVWSTPGGAVDPDETPADAIVRETWEETGLFVQPTRVLGVFGGLEFIVRYANGDESQYVIVAFECRRLSGKLVGDTDETIDARFVDQREFERLPVTAWMRGVLPSCYAPPAQTMFHPAAWRPPT